LTKLLKQKENEKMTNTKTNKIMIGKKEIELKALTTEQAQQELESLLKWNNELTIENNYRKLANMITKEDEKIFNEVNQKEVDAIEIHIEWKKSQTWGNVPHAEAIIRYKDGTLKYSKKYTATGCGYDKQSSVVADIFNDYLKYKLYQVDSTTKKPYGVSIDKFKYYDGGVGINCYIGISKYIGGEFETIISNNKTDVFRYIDNN
jgi:glycosyltransferase involved in cell wall biosynthesis